MAQPPRTLLMFGSTDPAVTEFQDKLKLAGAADPPIELSKMGRFGPRTQAAVIKFQKASGPEPDGRVGPRTWDALDSVA